MSRLAIDVSWPAIAHNCGCYWEFSGLYLYFWIIRAYRKKNCNHEVETCWPIVLGWRISWWEPKKKSLGCYYEQTPLHRQFSPLKISWFHLFLPGFDIWCYVAQVVISQMNGQDNPSHSVHAFNVGKMRIKLCRGWITKSREIYSTTMQVFFSAWVILE